ncbi:GNAT family N-acetyltransferase [Amycolatopsis sp. NPDC004378]
MPLLDEATGPARLATTPDVAGNWSVTIDPPHPDEDNEGRIALAANGREVGFVLFLDCPDATVWIDTIHVAHQLRGNGIGNRLLALVLALNPGRRLGLAAPTATLAAWYARSGFVPSGPDGVMHRAATP